MHEALKPPRSWAPWAMVAGGLLMAAVWLVFTNLHGPTSFNEGRKALGHDMHGWGLLLGVGPNILIGAALLALRPRLTRSGSRMANVGHRIVVVSVFASAALDLVFMALGPPFFMPLVGIGALVLALGLRNGAAAGAATRWIVGILGVTLLVATALAWMPMDFSDSIGGYRIFGAIGYLMAGLLWAGAGATLVARPATARSEPVMAE